MARPTPNRVTITVDGREIETDEGVMLIDADGKAAVRQVTVGAIQGTDMLITAGLQPGDQVIVNGLQKLRPGAAVNPKPWQAGTPPQIHNTSAPTAK